MSRVTIADVARHCGVHHATVSRALRDADGPSPATRQRVKTAAEELGYQHPWRDA